MKTRVVSSIFLLALLLSAGVFFDTAAFNLIVAGIACLAVYELLSAAGFAKDRWVLALMIGYTLVVLLGELWFGDTLFSWAVFLLGLGTVALLLREHETVTMENLALGAGSALFVTFSFSSAFALRAQFGPTLGFYYVLIALGSSWWADTGAYFAGRFFGRTKLAPRISPKKTVEGAIGGVLMNVVGSLLLSMGYSLYCGRRLGLGMQVDFLVLALLAVPLAVLGMLGDLTASVLKRQRSLKDYSNLIPGHGGVMDRFDSALFTLPATWLVLQSLQFASLLPK